MRETVSSNHAYMHAKLRNLMELRTLEREMIFTRHPKGMGALPGRRDPPGSRASQLWTLERLEVHDSPPGVSSERSRKTVESLRRILGCVYGARVRGEAWCCRCAERCHTGERTCVVRPWGEVLLLRVSSLAHLDREVVARTISSHEVEASECRDASLPGQLGMTLSPAPKSILYAAQQRYLARIRSLLLQLHE